MARVLAVYAHHGVQSFNRAVLDRLTGALEAAGHLVDVSDLYAERFDPLMTVAELSGESTPLEVQRAQARVLEAEVLWFVYPTWWWTPPAVLKGWIERVICLGFAFRFDIKRNGYAGLLEGRRAFVVSTGSSDPATYPTPWQTGAHQDFVKDVLAISGIPVIEHLALKNVHRYADRAELATALESVERLAARV